MIFVGFTETVDGRYRRNDDCIGPFEHGFGRRQTHLLDVFVDRRVFFDIGVRSWHISLGLVVVVVGNEIFDRILREKIAHLAV